MPKMVDMAATPDPADLLGTSQAAAELDLVPSTISRMVKEGRMTPAMRLPGKTGAMLFARDEIERVARELTQPEVAAS